MSVDPIAVQRSVQELLAGIDTTEPGTYAVSEGLKALISAASQVLSVECIGVLLVDEDEQLRSVASSGPMAAILEQAQQEIGVGPGIDTMCRSATVTVEDLSQVDQYAPLRSKVSEHGVQAVVSAPIWVNGAVAGNLNAIRSRPHQWSNDEITAVETYADVVGTLLQFNASSVRLSHPERDRQAHSPAPGRASTQPDRGTASR
jgi:GAF domain-containing protein